MGFGWHPINEMEHNPVMFEPTNQAQAQRKGWNTHLKHTHIFQLKDLNPQTSPISEDISTGWGPRSSSRSVAEKKSLN